MTQSLSQIQECECVVLEPASAPGSDLIDNAPSEALEWDPAICLLGSPSPSDNSKVYPSLRHLGGVSLFLFCKLSNQSIYTAGVENRGRGQDPEPLILSCWTRAELGLLHRERLRSGTQETHYMACLWFCTENIWYLMLFQRQSSLTEKAELYV